MKNVQKSRTVVEGKKTVEIFHVKEGQKCYLLNVAYDNGEHHARLEDMETGNIFESPYVFWEEVQND